MWKRRIAWLLVLVFVLMPVCISAQDAPLEQELPFEVNAASVLLMDAATGTVILERNADEQRPVASITKLMTMLLVLEALDEGKLSLEQQITVSEEAAGMGGSQALLDAGGVYPLEDLLKSLIVASANDSAVALAELLAGSEDSFAEMMNHRAQELGLTGTVYKNASGLPAEGQHTTARDVAMLSLEVLKHPIYYKYSTIWMDEIRHKNDRVTELVNTNRLIRFYDGADGVKTGSTNEAGFCISASAKRGEQRYIAVVLGARSGKERFAIAQRLLNFAFDHYETRVLVKAGEPLERTVPVKGAAVKEASIAAQSDLAVLVKKSAPEIQTELSVPQTLQAPLKKGEVIGEVIATQEGSVVARVPLILLQDFEKKGFFTGISHIWASWFRCKMDKNEEQK